MLSVTWFRFLLMFIIGLVFYWVLLYEIGIMESRHLRVRRKTTDRKQRKRKAGVVFVYIVGLLLVITLTFMVLE